MRLMPRHHSARAGGLAAALGDAGFGTPARRGSLPSPALGVSMLPAAGRRVPQLGMVAFQAKKRAPPACERGLKYEGRPGSGSSTRLQAACGSGATPVWGQPYAKITHRKIA